GRYLSFAAGIVVLVTMGQRRQWRWFAIMLALVALLTYGPDVLPALSLPRMGSSDSANAPYLATLAPRYIAFPAFVPLALLFYRPTRMHDKAGDHQTESGLEVGPLITHETAGHEG